MSGDNKSKQGYDVNFDELRRQSQPKEVELAEYALNEQMTIPNFDNQIHKDSGWNRRKTTR